MSIRVVTFNMQNAQPWIDDDPFPTVIDVDGVGAFLNGLNADVICLQEVERGHDGGMQVEPPPNFTRLRDLLPSYDSVFSYPLKNETELPFGLGLAIFSRSKLFDFEKIDLPSAQVEFEFEGKKRRTSSRLLLQAFTRLDGRNVKILNTHLQAFFMIGDSSDSHPTQRNIVEAHLREGGHEPAILAGDMNSSPAESLVKQFENAGFRTAQNETTTWRRMPFVTDHLFYNAALRLVSQSVEVTSTSDHHAVVADFDLA